MSSLNTINTAMTSDSDDKQAKAAEKKRQEEELRRRAEEKRQQKEEAERQMKAEEERQRQKEAEEERQRQKEADEAFHQEADRQAAIVQVRRKNWLKKMNPELVASPPFEEEMNLINLPPLTKRQWVQYLPKETLEQRQECKEMARELGIEPMGAGSPCERCANFGILCLPQDLP